LVKKSSNFFNLKSACKNIQLVISDVDGVLTDGGMYYSNDGEIMKKFHARDGMAVELLLQKNIFTILMTKEKSQIVKKRASKIKIKQTFLGVLKKEELLEKLCSKYSLKSKNIAYIGDDVNDVEIMKLVGFSASPHDGVFEVKKIAQYICKNNGGNGAFREFVDLIISNKSS
jgi:3-deoxy-D-manno-octulosonate 8-phosphate phosphatase (KDO 8-P phosphatase)